MDFDRRAGDACSIAQKLGLFLSAFNQMDLRPRNVGERAGKYEAGKSGAGAEVHPYFCLRQQISKLQQISNVPRPQTGDRRSRNQVGVLLPLQQQRHEVIQPPECFT